MKTSRYIVMALAMIAMAACGPKPGAETKETEKEDHHEDVVELTQRQMQTVGITMGRVENRQLASTVSANGELMLNPQDRAEVTPIIGGVVRRIIVVEGQRVAAGQAVAMIENTEVVSMQKDYLIAVKERDMARQELNRQKLLSQQGAGVVKTLQQATAAYETAQARLTGLYHQLVQVGVNPAQAAAGHIVSRIAVRAPISGTVSKVGVSIGSYVDATSSMMQIDNNAAVYASLNVFERNISQVRVGQVVDLVATNSPGSHFKGRVLQINRSMGDDTKAMAVHVRIEGERTAGMVAGMYVTGLINTGEQSVPALPDDAIVSAEGKNYIFALESREGKGEEETLHFKRVEVVTGASALGYTQVNFVDSLAATATVVKSKAFYLASMGADHGEH